MPEPCHGPFTAVRALKETAFPCRAAGSKSGAQLQTLDLDQVTKVEARGNQVIFTLSDGSESESDQPPQPVLDEVSGRGSIKLV